MVIIGIDPGSHSALIRLSLPRYPLLDGATWRRERLNMPTNKQARDASFFYKAKAILTTMSPSAPHPPVDMVVVEQPLDALVSWRGKHRQKKGTAFRLGASYGLLIAAVAEVLEDTPLATYSIQGYGNGALAIPGWMRGKTHENMVQLAVNFIRTILPSQSEALVKDSWSDDELMAMALILRHLEMEDATFNRNLTTAIAGVMPDMVESAAPLRGRAKTLKAGSKRGRKQRNRRSPLGPFGD